jgi:hypothetical protein
MLLRYKPGPKFAIRSVSSLSESDVSINLQEVYPFTHWSSIKFYRMLVPFVGRVIAHRRLSRWQLPSVTQSLSGGLSYVTRKSGIRWYSS